MGGGAGSAGSALCAIRDSSGGATKIFGTGADDCCGAGDCCGACAVSGLAARDALVGGAPLRTQMANACSLIRSPVSVKTSSRKSIWDVSGV
jgi:hypothetical protein